MAISGNIRHWLTPIRGDMALAQQDGFAPIINIDPDYQFPFQKIYRKFPPASANPSFGIRDFEAATSKQLGNVLETHPGSPGYPDWECLDTNSAASG